MSIRVSPKVGSPTPRVQANSAAKVQAQAKATPQTPPPTARQARPSVDTFEPASSQQRSFGRGHACNVSASAPGDGRADKGHGGGTQGS